MPSSRAIVPTPHASRYLQQLCKHWSHRFDATFDAQDGRVDFGGGETLDLAAQGDGLAMTVAAMSPADLAALENVVAAHLQRFAFREALDVTWAPFVAR